MEKTRQRSPNGGGQRDGQRPVLPASNRVLVSSVIASIATTFAISSYWLPPHRQDSIVPRGIPKADFEYGLARCALDHERPTVDWTLASTRLAARTGTGSRKIFLNATLIDGDGTVTWDCNIEVQDGIFTKVSTDPRDFLELDWSPNTELFDLGGRVVTPGLIDIHSHVGVRETPQLWATEDVTEISAPVTPWGRAIDAFKPHDEAIPVIASGGVTTSLVLTGAKNQISGEGVVVKMKHADSVRGMLVDQSEGGGKPQRYLKMAMGENQKRQFQNSASGPSTRIGESYWYRKAYESARRVKLEQDQWCAVASKAAGPGSISQEYPRSLEWQTLVDVLRGDVNVNVHGYETEDILAMFDHADEFGFNITALHHALHADLLIDEIRDRGIAVVGFADSWGDKKELYDVSSYFPRKIADSGIPFAVTRDHPALHGQWLAYEAQIGHHFGLKTRHAISSVIAVPARLLGLDNRLGFVQPGYDADLVVWDRHPMRVGATPLEVFIDGSSVVNASDRLWNRSKSPEFKMEAPQPRPTTVREGEGECEPGQSDMVLRGLRESFVGDNGQRGQETETGDVTAVIRSGRAVCVGETKCEDLAKQAIDEDVPVVELEQGYLLPGLTVVTRLHGLVEMRQEPSTTDGASAGDGYDRPLESRFGIKFDGMHLERAYRGGVTRIVTPPLTDGFFHGISSLFRAGARSVLDDGAIAVPGAALHFTIGHDGKSPATPSITSQVSKLRDLLTIDKHIHPVYQRAAKGEVPIVVHTNNKDIIAHMVALKRETGAHIVIMGGAEAHLLATELADAKMPVISAPFWGCEPLFWDGRNCLPGPPLKDQLGPQVLMAAGVQVAISNFDDTNNHIRNSIWEASWVAGPGNHSMALDLVSKNIEDILLLPRTQDFVVYEGSPFEFGSRVALIFEEGKIQRCYPDVDEVPRRQRIEAS